MPKLSQGHPTATYRLVRGAHVELMPDCALLFSEPHQQVHRLSASGAGVASRLQRGATWDDLVNELCAADVDTKTATDWVAALLGQLADAAVLETRPASDGTIARSATFEVAGVTFALHFHSTELFDLVAGAYVCLEKENALPDHTYHLSEDREFVLFGKANGPAQVVRRATAAVRVKTAILEDVLGAHERAAALHAACVLRKDAALLLLGPPGTGKTTLSLALLRHGFGFGSDDVTLVMPGGNLQTVPLPAAIKESAWEAAGHLGIDLSGVPVHCRPDGQRVCFYPVPEARFDTPPRVGAIVRLRRSPGSKTAIRPISREQTLVALFEESRSFDGRCSTEIMQALAQLVRHGECLDLHYAEAADGASFLAGYSM